MLIEMKKVKMGLILTIIAASLICSTPVTAKNNIIHVPHDYSTIAEAVENASPGDIIVVEPGEYEGCLLTKQVTIRGTMETVINSGPMHPAGLSQGFRLLEGSGGSKFQNLVFTTDFAIMNGAGVDNVVVSHCVFIDTIQAVSNWGGSGWVISHNNIHDLRTRNGGGIGILIADRFGGTVKDNVVEHNTVTGTLHVYSGDGGGYCGSGIVLYADFRWGMSGAESIQDNIVRHNKVAMISDTPEVVDIVAFELTDTRNDPEIDPVLTENTVTFNDFRGTENQIALTPEILADYNTITRNLGDNRGYGAHPKAH